MNDARSCKLNQTQTRCVRIEIGGFGIESNYRISRQRFHCPSQLVLSFDYLVVKGRHESSGQLSVVSSQNFRSQKLVEGKGCRVFCLTSKCKSIAAVAPR